MYNKKNYLPCYGPLKATVWKLLDIYIFFNCVSKLLWYREQRLKISGLYDENCARGTHLKFLAPST